MIRIGLLGNIGSGKTYVGQLFNFPIFNADEQVKKIYKKNRRCFNKLKKKFPNFIKTFPVKKVELIKILNKENINIISKIVHPFVRKELVKFLKKNKKKKYVILDVPLLIENNLHRKNDILIYVKASRHNIIKRLKIRGNYNSKIIEILQKQQIDKNKKIKLSNYVVDNNKNKKYLLKRINYIKDKIKC